MRWSMVSGAVHRWMMRRSWSAVEWLPTVCRSTSASRRARRASICRGRCLVARCTRCVQARARPRTWSQSWRTKACVRASATMTTTRHRSTGMYCSLTTRHLTGNILQCCTSFFIQRPLILIYCGPDLCDSQAVTSVMMLVETKHQLRFHVKSLFLDTKTIVDFLGTTTV